MWCDAGFGGVNHNNSHETFQRNFQRGTQGLIGNKMNSGPFMGFLCRYATDYSEESYDKFVKSAEGLGTLQSIAVPRKIDYDLVQTLHPKTLIGICCQRSGPQAVPNAFNAAMEHVTFQYGNKDIPVYQKIRNAHTVLYFPKENNSKEKEFFS